jgi:hypothetical protein
MGARFPKTVTVPLEVTTLRHADAELASIACPKCQAALNINQPEPDIPDQLLGACSSCGAWFVVWIDGAENEVIVLYLAVVDFMRNKLGTA